MLRGATTIRHPSQLIAAHALQVLFMDVFGEVDDPTEARTCHSPHGAAFKLKMIPQGLRHAA
jgi:hypothetical protein